MILKLCTVVRCISDLLIIRFDLHHFTIYHNAYLHNRMPIWPSPITLVLYCMFTGRPYTLDQLMILYF